MKKKNIRQLDYKSNPFNGKGKHILILPEEYDDEDELHARAAKINEDAAKSKVFVKE